MKPEKQSNTPEGNCRRRKHYDQDDFSFSSEHSDFDAWASWSYNFYYHFFSPSGSYRAHFPGDEDDWCSFFDQQREIARKRYQRMRRAQLRMGFDRRDSQAKSSNQDVCSFCGTKAGISFFHAMNNGIDWKEYASHPEEYKTCWDCKNNHVSVMTEKMAITKLLSKKLEPKTLARTETIVLFFGCFASRNECFTISRSRSFARDTPVIRSTIGVQV